jgi:GNAT superfamily N-acetyltransferase
MIDANFVFADEHEGRNLDPALRNHLAFLATHRGTLATTNSGVSLDGAAPFLSFFSPLDATAEIPAGCDTVWLYPWSGAGWPERLETAGFAAAEQLITMRLGSRPARTTRPNCMIELVENRIMAIEFADVQARGFLTGQSDHKRWWIHCFRAMALRNFASPDQHFLLARDYEDPAAVLLTVRTGNTVGIYAVATVPEHRGKGFSTTLLQRAVETAQAKGASAIILQVAGGSYAHGFYQRLGFKDDYVCQVWRK